jgi:protein-tyrosine kinase
MSIVERAANMLGKIPEPKPVPAEVLPEVKSDPLPPDLVERYVAQKSAKPDFSNNDNFVPKAAQAALPAADDHKTSATIKIDLNRLREQNMITPDGERTAVSESFRRVKRHLLANVSSPDAPPGANLIMITSSLPKEGKTFCSVNLAISLAMEMDRRVLLVDADVLRPSVNGALGINYSIKGLMDVLSDGVSLADVICRTNIEKLSLLPAGRRHSHANELLASDAMRALLKEMGERYHDRIILFDSPPLLATSESCVLASLMGQVLVVVEAGITTEVTLRDAISRISSKNNVIGVVLNKGVAPGSALYGGYGYGYGYGDADGRKA